MGPRLRGDDGQRCAIFCGLPHRPRAYEQSLRQPCSAALWVPAFARPMGNVVQFSADYHIAPAPTNKVCFNPALRRYGSPPSRARWATLCNFLRITTSPPRRRGSLAPANKVCVNPALRRYGSPPSRARWETLCNFLRITTSPPRRRGSLAPTNKVCVNPALRRYGSPPSRARWATLCDFCGLPHRPSAYEQSLRQPCSAALRVPAFAGTMRNGQHCAARQLFR